MKTKTINVTQGDIDRGVCVIPEYGKCGSCPIARAMSRSFKKKIGIIMVGPYDFSLNCWKTVKPLPETVKKFVRDFDNGKLVKPFTFELEY